MINRSSYRGRGKSSDVTFLCWAPAMRACETSDAIHAKGRRSNRIAGLKIFARLPIS